MIILLDCSSIDLDNALIIRMGFNNDGIESVVERLKKSMLILLLVEI